MRGHREHNGRLSRRVVHIRAREDMTIREAQSVVVAARMRHTGLSEEQVRRQEGGTVVGRLYYARELNADQVQAAATYLQARNAYHRAIDAVSDTGRAPRPESGGGGTYEEFCDQAKRRWGDITKALQSAMVDIRSPSPIAALDYLVVRDVYVGSLVGDLRTVLNVLHRLFSQG